MVKFADYPQRTCRENVIENDIDHSCSLPEHHPGPHCPRSLASAIARREQWEADNPGWEKLMRNDDPFEGLPHA